MIVNMILVQFITYIFMAFTFGVCIAWLFSSYVDERRTKCNQDHASHVREMDQLYINRLLDHIGSLEDMIRGVVKNKLENKMDTHSIICASCGSKVVTLDSLSDPDGYWLCLNAVKEPPNSPWDRVLGKLPINSEKHFCCITCVRRWADDNE